MEVFRAPNFVPLYQNAGSMETELKHKLAAALRKFHTVQRAYLAAVSYGDGPVNIALCLRFDGDRHDVGAIQAAAQIFAEMFAVDQALDIVPMNGNQEALVSELVEPFYRA